MGVKYLKFSIAIHGIDAENEVAVPFLEGWLKGAIISVLTGNVEYLFNFRNESTSDIEVELLEQGGEFSIKCDDT